MDYLAQARVHIDRGQKAEAEQCLTTYLNSNFNSAEALFMLGALLLGRDQWGASAALTKQALAIRPDFPEALLNLGTAYKRIHDNETAKKYWDFGLELETIPLERAKILANMAGLYINEGTPEKALPLVNAALELVSDEPSAMLNKALVMLELGYWREGWEFYKARFRTGDGAVRHYGGLPWWNGEKGKTVIVYGDQGMGDEIMWASMLPDLIRDCKKVIFDCHPRLANLFQRSFPTVDVKGTRKTINLEWHHDCGAEFSIALSSLGAFYRNEDADFPGKPFLKAEPSQKPHRRMRIGLSWSGGIPKTRSDLRSIPLLLLEPMLRAVDADWYSLQYGDTAPRDVCELEEKTGIRIRHFPNLANAQDYDQVAGFVASMDLVITVCTSIHHLSNAIGVPTWTLVPSKPAWRYAAKGQIFYSGTSRFFRQPAGESWAPVITSVGEALADHARISATERAVA